MKSTHRSIPLLLPLLASCASWTGSFNAPRLPALLKAPAADGDAFVCIQRELGNLGYQTTAADKASGFLAAERPQPNQGLDAALGLHYVEQVRATVLAPSDGSRPEIQLALKRVRVGSSSDYIIGQPQYDAAQAVLKSCGETTSPL